MPHHHEHGAEAPGLATPVALSRYAAKRFRTLQAKAALCGCELHALATGGFLLTRWGLTRELRSIDEVAQLLAQIGCQA
jgi:hypothetical protein